MRGWWQILITGAIYSQIYSQIPKKERHSRRTGGGQAENRTSKGCQQEGRRTAGNRRSRGEEREGQKEEQEDNTRMTIGEWEDRWSEEGEGQENIRRTGREQGSRKSTGAVHEGQ